MTEYFQLGIKRFVPDLTSYLFFRHKDDLELWGAVRGVVDPGNPNALPGAPAVYVLHESSMTFTRQWQEAMVYWNGGMTAQHIAALFGSSTAFCNGDQNGFNPNIPHRNYFTNENLDASSYPKFDKIRTCARSIFRGLVGNGYLIPDMMDGTQPPPLSVHPSTHPWLFFAANNMNGKGTTFPFAHGGFYNWTPDGPLRPYSFLPNVVKFINGENPIRIATSRVVPSYQLESPYRSYG